MRDERQRPKLKTRPIEQEGRWLPVKRVTDPLTGESVQSRQFIETRREKRGRPAVPRLELILGIIALERAKSSVARDADAAKPRTALAHAILRERFPREHQTAKNLSRVGRWLRDPANRRPPWPIKS